jgi:predicted Fe-Mo cluster-binding NifX family protein
MKVAVSATGKDLDSQLDPRFGRAEYFLVVDTVTMEVYAIENTASLAAGGAGIQAAQKVAGEGVESVITGSVGPNAMDVLKAAEIPVFSAPPLPVKDILRQFENKALPEITAPKPRHYGARAGRGWQ